jgi:hypothetical protein
MHTCVYTHIYTHAHVHMYMRTHTPARALMHECIQWVQNVLKVITGCGISHENAKCTELVSYRYIKKALYYVLKCYTVSIM